MQTEGYIYILFNPAYRANQYKIGMTTKTPEKRALEISASTGVPYPFEVLYERRVVDCRKAERLIHQRLATWRGSTGREFFVLPLKTAVGVLNDIAAEIGVVEEGHAPLVAADLPNSDAPFSGEIDVMPRSKAAKRAGKVRVTTTARFEDHVDYTDAIRQPLLRQLRQDITAMDDRLVAGETVTPAQRIVYKIAGGKNFMELKVQRSAILVRLIETRLADPRLAIRKIPESHGWGDLKDELRITNVSELEYALQFVRGAYQLAVR